MAGGNLESTVLHEHRKIVSFRYVVALLNFVAILAGTLVTRHYVLIRGTSDGILLLINLMWIINIAQIALCLSDYVLKTLFGKYVGVLVKISYIVGGVWLAVVVAELIVGSVVLGSLRLDLAVISGLQLLSALIAYVIAPALDHFAIQAMTSPNVREDREKRAKKAKAGAARYVVVGVMMVIIQAGMLFAYKLPPKVYDLFAESRALQYKLTEDEAGNEVYEVIGVYEGTSTFVNIPALYNNKPVVKIAKNALTNASFLEKHKVATIEIGTLTKDENGNEIYECNITVIEDGAINNDKITEINLPVSVLKIGDRAIESDSLKTIVYASRADFSYSYLDCPALETITFDGKEAGKIVSLDGMDPAKTKIEVDQAHYDVYREKNKEYMASIRPILDDNQYVIDFYTDSDYYIKSIIMTIGERVEIGYQDLKNDDYEGASLSVDTLAYINNKHETGTMGAKSASAFRGWYYDKTFNEECTFAEDGKLSFAKNTALYAKWIPEYTGTLDWSTYHPEGEKTTYYWTDEDLVTFPSYHDDGKVREGYSDGIRWFLDGVQLTSSQNVSRDVTITGEWVFDKPVIDIAPYAQNETLGNFVIATDKNTVTYTYDEHQAVMLDAVMSHPYDGLTYNGVEFSYATDWVKVDDDNYYKANSTVSMSGVLESGEYKLTVTAKSPWGETSTAETGINIIINKKDIDLGDVGLANVGSIYNAQNQYTTYTGTLATERIKVTYKYYDENGDEITSAENVGVKNAGRYTVKAIFEKNNYEEAANYGTKELNAEFTISPKQLEYLGWSVDSLVYNATEQKVNLLVGGIHEADTTTTEIVYEGNTATDAGSYTAKATGVSNSNYTISNIDTQNNCVHNWEITPKPVDIDNSSWTIDGSNTSTFEVTYNGKEHVISVTPSGILAADVGNVNFIFDEHANTMKATDANSYTAKIIGVDNSNYTLVGESTKEWKILKKQITVNFENPSPFTYTGKDQSINATISGIVESDLSDFTREMFLYDGKSEVVSVGAAEVVDNVLVIPFSAKNANTYNAAISDIDSAAEVFKNYVLAAPSTRTFEIKPKVITIVNEDEYTYNGKYQTLAIKISGIVSEDLDGVRFEHFTQEGAVEGNRSGNYFELTLNAKDAGTYSIAVNAFDNSNYQLTAATNNIVIEKQILTIDWFITDKSGTDGAKPLTDSASFTYNYAGYDVSASINGAVNGENVTITLTDAVGIKNAASYVTKAELLADSEGINKNYAFDTDYINWQITPYVVNFKWTFNGASHSIVGGNVPKFTYDSNAVKVEPQYTLLGDDKLNISYASGYSDTEKTNASSKNYKVKISSIGNENYKIGNGSSFEWKIDPKVVTVNWADANVNRVTYDGKSHGLKFTIDGLIDIDDRYIAVYIADGDTSALFDRYEFDTASSAAEYFISGDGVIVDAGEYTVTLSAIYKMSGTEYSSEADGNYIVSCAGEKITVDKAPLTLGGWTVTNGSDTKAFNESTKLVYNAQPYTLSNSIKTALCKRGELTDDVTLAYDHSSSKDAGDYVATARLVGTHADNYYIVSGDTAEWSIDKKVITAEWTLNNFTYNGNYFTQSATYKSGAMTANDNAVYDGDSINIIYSGNSYINAGAYTAKIISLGNDNYQLDSSCESYSWTIGQAAVSISWDHDTFVYNGAVQHPVAKYNSSVYVTEYETTESKNVGTYQIIPVALNNSNYVIEDSYKVAYTYTITPKTVNFTWGFDDNKSNARDYTYDGTTKVLNAYVSNICSGDTVNINYDLNTKLSRTIHDAKSYTVTVTGIDNANYSFNELSENATKTVVVSKRPVTIAWSYNGSTSNAVNYTYDGSTKTIVAYVSNLCTGDTVNPVYGAGSRELHDAADYSFSVTGISGDDAENYDLSATVSKNITVAKRELRFDWYFGNNKSSTAQDFVYDGKTYTLNAAPTVTTLVSGESVTLSYDKDRSICDIGSYTIYVNGLSGDDAKNYVLPSSSNCKKTVNVSQQTVSITWSGDTSVVYDGTAHYLTATVTGISDGKVVTLTPMYSNSQNSKTDAGTYTITVNGLFENKNYKLPTNGSQNATLVIDKQPVTITWEGTEEVTYDGASHSLVATVKGANDNKSVPFKYNNNSNQYTNAGTYDIIVTLNNNNYTTNGADNTKQLVINKQVLTIEWGGAESVVYDGNTHALTFTAKNAAGTMVAVARDGSYFSGSPRNVGSYTYKIVSITYSTDSNNYALPTDGSAERTLVIEPQPVRIRWNGYANSEYEVTYDGSYHYLEASVVGKNDYQSVGFSYTTDTTYINNVGTLTTGVQLNNSNYTLDGADGSATATLTIVPQKVSIVWSGAGTYTFDGEYHSLTPIITSEKGTEISLSKVLLNGNTYFKDVGEYECTILEIQDTNYTLEGCTGSLTASAEIVPLDVTVTWTDAYGNPYSENTATVQFNSDYHTVNVNVADSEGNIIYEDSYSAMWNSTYDFVVELPHEAKNYNITGDTTFVLIIQMP